MATETKQEITVSRKPQSEAAETHKTTTLFGPLEEAERLFDRLMPRSWMHPMVWNWPLWGSFEETVGSIRIPLLDIIDHDAELLIRIEVPGVEKKDIQVSLTNSTLTIRSSTNRHPQEQRQDYLRSEIIHGNFSRTLALPKEVDTAAISATLKDGILEVVLPKVESQQRRAVEVK